MFMMLCESPHDAYPFIIYPDSNFVRVKKHTKLNIYHAIVQGTDTQQNAASAMCQLADILSRGALRIHRGRIERKKATEEGSGGGGGGQIAGGGGAERMETSCERGVLNNIVTGG